MSHHVAIIGAGPAGLMAADAASAEGAKVTIYDQMPSVARKFLMAGKSGLNITHTDEKPAFLDRYGDDPRIRLLVEGFGSDAVRRFMAELGIPEHIGSTGRVFPRMMKASPLLRAWLARLAGRGVEVRPRHRLISWDGARRLTFDTPEGEQIVEPDSIVFACGGGSWRRLGSDGSWTVLFESADRKVRPFRPSNVGLMVRWSSLLIERYEGAPLKNVRFTAPNGEQSRGEAVITNRGLESGGIYPLASILEQGGILTIDLLPGRTEVSIAERLFKQRKGQSLSNSLRKAVKVEGLKAALLREGAIAEDLRDAAKIAARLKALPLRVEGTVPLDEAISTRGGVPWPMLDEDLMLKGAPGVYCAGEMIDWDAPTGGYLITACLATGERAGWAAARA